MGIPNLSLLWLSWQRGWAKRYTALPEMQNFRIKRRAFCLVPPDGGLLVRQNAVGVLPLCDDRRTPASLSLSLLAQSEAVVYLENGLT